MALRSEANSSRSCACYEFASSFLLAMTIVFLFLYSGGYFLVKINTTLLKSDEALITFL